MSYYTVFPVITALVVIGLSVYAIYLLFTIRKLLYKITIELDTVEYKSKNIPEYLEKNIHLIHILMGLNNLNKELKHYIKRSS